MQQGYFSEHWKDSNGMPAGGVSTGRGFSISWQNGPLGSGDSRREPNGAFVEDVIHAARNRIDFYQASGFACDENDEAIEYLNKALAALDRRTQRRVDTGIEGTHEGK